MFVKRSELVGSFSLINNLCCLYVLNRYKSNYRLKNITGQKLLKLPVEITVKFSKLQIQFKDKTYPQCSFSPFFISSFIYFSILTRQQEGKHAWASGFAVFLQKINTCRVNIIKDPSSCSSLVFWVWVGAVFIAFCRFQLECSLNKSNQEWTCLFLHL